MRRLTARFTRSAITVRVPMWCSFSGDAVITVRWGFGRCPRRVDGTVLNSPPVFE